MLTQTDLKEGRAHSKLPHIIVEALIERAVHMRL